MIHATTQRLVLRDFEVSDFPRTVELIGDWDVSRWMAVVPHPYELRHAQEFYDKLRAEAGTEGGERFFVIALAESNAMIGSIGMGGRSSLSLSDGTVIGYWLGKPYWGQGYMSEALGAALKIAFAPEHIAHVKATTHPDNAASMNVLRKAGFSYLGVHPVSEPNLWGRTEETRWGLAREDLVELL